MITRMQHGKTAGVNININVMVDGSWQAYDEFIEDVVEHGDNGEQVKVVSLENLLCSYNVMINEEELSL